MDVDVRKIHLQNDNPMCDALMHAASGLIMHRSGGS